jgi:hypothetical protein
MAPCEVRFEYVPTARVLRVGIRHVVAGRGMCTSSATNPIKDGSIGGPAAGEHIEARD